jgi:hypothetical protein
VRTIRQGAAGFLLKGSRGRRVQGTGFCFIRALDFVLGFKM